MILILKRFLSWFSWPSALTVTDLYFAEPVQPAPSTVLLILHSLWLGRCTLPPTSTLSSGLRNGRLAEARTLECRPPDQLREPKIRQARRPNTAKVILTWILIENCALFCATSGYSLKEVIGRFKESPNLKKNLHKVISMKRLYI